LKFFAILAQAFPFLTYEKLFLLPEPLLLFDLSFTGKTFLIEPFKLSLLRDVLFTKSS